MSLIETIRYTDARKTMAKEFALSINSSTILSESERMIPGMIEYRRPEKCDELLREIEPDVIKLVSQHGKAIDHSMPKYRAAVVELPPGGNGIAAGSNEILIFFVFPSGDAYIMEQELTAYHRNSPGNVRYLLAQPGAIAVSWEHVAVRSKSALRCLLWPRKLMST